MVFVLCLVKGGIVFEKTRKKSVSERDGRWRSVVSRQEGKILKQKKSYSIFVLLCHTYESSVTKQFVITKTLSRFNTHSHQVKQLGEWVLSINPIKINDH